MKVYVVWTANSYGHNGVFWSLDDAKRSTDYLFDNEETISEWEEDVENSWSRRYVWITLTKIEGSPLVALASQAE